MIAEVKEGLTGIESILLWSGSLGALVYAFFDHKDTCEEIEASHGSKKNALRLKLLLLWAVPTLGLIGAYASQLSDAKSEQIVDDLRTNVVGLTFSLNTATNTVSTLQRRLTSVEAASKDRRITPAQHKELVAVLKDGPKGMIKVQSDWTDTEAKIYADDIRRVFLDAGFEEIETNVPVLSIMQTGVMMFVLDRDRAPSHAPRIQRAFAGIGEFMDGANPPTSVSNVLKENPNVVVIWVGHKPADRSVPDWWK